MSKTILAKRTEELRSQQMNAALKSSELADYRRGLGIFLTETPPTDTPKHLFRPHFPALRSDPMAFQGPPAESKFLAAKAGTARHKAFSKNAEIYRQWMGEGK